MKNCTCRLHCRFGCSAAAPFSPEGRPGSGFLFRLAGDDQQDAHLVKAEPAGQERPQVFVGPEHQKRLVGQAAKSRDSRFIVRFCFGKRTRPFRGKYAAGMGCLCFGCSRGSPRQTLPPPKNRGPRLYPEAGRSCGLTPLRRRLAYRRFSHEKMVGKTVSLFECGRLYGIIDLISLNKPNAGPGGMKKDA